MTRSLTLVLVTLVALGCVIGAYLLTKPRDNKPTIAEDQSNGPALPTKEQKPAPLPKTPAQIVEADYLQAESAAERIELIRKAAAMPDAKSNMPLLRKAMVSDADEGVQVEAFTKSLDLGEKEGLGMLIESIRRGLEVTSPRVRVAALKEARLHPSPTLVPVLVAMVEGEPDYRGMALTALAFTEDLRAKAKVLEVASSADGDRSVRIRAISLLIQTKDPNARELLRDLSASSDDELRQVALEVLDALNK